MSIAFKTIVLMALVVMTDLTAATTTPVSTKKLKLLPSGRLFRLTFADPREIRMALMVRGSARIDAYLGNYFSLFSIRSDKPEDWRAHFGIEGAGYFAMRQADRRFPLESTDGLLGLYVDWAQGPLHLQTRYTHISAHLSDGSDGTAFPYSRELVQLRAGYLWTPRIHSYLGVHHLVNSVPKLPPWGVQWGGSLFLNTGVGKFVPFIATDFQWREETTFNPSWSLQLGLALNNPPEAYRSFRFFYSYYTGADPRGQFYQQLRNAHSFGIEMQI